MAERLPLFFSGVVVCYLLEVVLKMIPIDPMVKVFVSINRRAGTR